MKIILFDQYDKPAAVHLTEAGLLHGAPSLPINRENPEKEAAILAAIRQGRGPRIKTKKGLPPKTDPED